MLKRSRLKYVFFGGLLLAGVFCLTRALPAATAGSDFILDWAADSYVPPTYQGKALPVRGSQVTVAAIPTKKLVASPDKMYFRWLLDGKAQNYAKGQGQHSLTFTVKKWPGDYHEVEMQITSADDKLLDSYLVYVPVVAPEVTLEENGRTAATGEILVSTGQTAKLRALPFFFSTNRPTQDLTFDWFFEEERLDNPDGTDPDQLVMAVPQGELSEVLIKNVRLVVTNKRNADQQDSINLTVKIR